MYDTIIIGAGPSGLTAALYAGRYRLKALVLEKMVPGGQIILSPSIENFPGFPDGITTQELIDRMKKQVDEVEVPVENADVIGITEDSGGYCVKTQEQSFTAKTVIIASGAQAKRLNAVNEELFIGKGVSYCGTCDGPLFRNKEIIVVGGGDRAVEDALFLSGYASKVTLIHRRQGFRASEILIEKAKNEPKIHFRLDTVVEAINGGPKVSGVRLKNVKTSEITDFPCEGVFIFVGIKPNTEFIKNYLNIDETGFIITGHDLSTSRKNIYACGDCRQKTLYQVINACGDGAVAAHSVHQSILNHG